MSLTRNVFVLFMDFMGPALATTTHRDMRGGERAGGVSSCFLLLCSRPPRIVDVEELFSGSSCSTISTLTRTSTWTRSMESFERTVGTTAGRGHREQTARTAAKGISECRLQETTGKKPQAEGDCWLQDLQAADSPSPSIPKRPLICRLPRPKSS